MELSSTAAQTLLGPKYAALHPVQPVSAKDTVDQDSVTAFETLLDTLNPLQHIPGVNAAYREQTGDTANPLASMAGGFLFGGPIGLAAGAAGSFLEMMTGKSLAGHLQAFFSDGDASPAEEATHKIRTAASGADALLGDSQAIGLKDYQALASATNGIHQGIGATATEVGYAENMWTQQALKQASGQYETNQNLGNDKADRTDRSA